MAETNRVPQEPAAIDWLTAVSDLTTILVNLIALLAALPVARMAKRLSDAAEAVRKRASLEAFGSVSAKDTWQNITLLSPILPDLNRWEIEWADQRPPAGQMPNRSIATITNKRLLKEINKKDSGLLRMQWPIIVGDIDYEISFTEKTKTYTNVNIDRCLYIPGQNKLIDRLSYMALRVRNWLVG